MYVSHNHICVWMRVRLPRCPFVLRGQVKIHQHNYKCVTDKIEGNPRKTYSDVQVEGRRKKIPRYRLYSDFFGSISRPR